VAWFIVYALVGLLAIWSSDDRSREKAKRLRAEERRRAELKRHNRRLP